MGSKGKTIKDINDYINTVEGNLDITMTKVKSLEVKADGNTEVHQDILLSVKKLTTKLESIYTELSTKFDEHSTTITEQLAATSLSVKEDIAQIRSVVIARLEQDNRKLRSRVTHLEKRVLENEKRQNQQEQHARKIYFEVAGIPNSVTQDNLKATLVKIFNTGGITSNESDIEVTHRLHSKSETKNVIVKARRDFVDSVFKAKKKLLEVGRGGDLNFGPNNKLFVNEHLSPNFKTLRYNCKLLKNADCIEDFWFSNAKLKIKIQGVIHNICHEIDLFKINPEFHFTFATDLYHSFEDHELDQLDDLDGYNG